MIIYKFDLNVKNEGSAVRIPVRRYDSDIRLVVNLNDGRSNYEIPDGCRVVFAASKPDKTVILNDCRVEQNEIIYDFTPQTAAAEGRVKCEIRLYDAEGRLITSPHFLLDVKKRVTEEIEESFSTNERTVLDEIIVGEFERKANEEQRAAAEAARAEAFSNAESTVNKLIDQRLGVIENGSY